MGASGSRDDADGASVRSAAPEELEVRLWDPSSQLRFRAKRLVPPRPDGAPNRSPAAAGARPPGARDGAKGPPSTVASG